MKNLLTTWVKSKETLAIAKENELKLREALIEQNFKSVNTQSATVDLGDGKLQYKRTKTYKVHSDELSIIIDDLSELAKQALKWEPKLDTKLYKALPAQYREELEPVLELKHGQAQLKYTQGG